MRKVFKYLLPHGVTEIYANRRRLRDWGRPMPLADWWGSEWLVHEAETTGLALFPPGYWQQLHYVVDVGANVGQWSSMVLDLIAPQKLFAIEPGPMAFAELERALGSRRGVELRNIAIGDSIGVAQLNLTRDSTGASLLPPRDEMRALIGSNWSIQSAVECQVTTLDELLLGWNEISLLKIDVQGFEKAVLAGASQMLRKTKFLLMELNYMPQYEGGSWLGEIHEMLTRDFGFFLANASKPLCLNGRASMSDGLYVNEVLVQDWVQPEFV